MEPWVSTIGTVFSGISLALNFRGREPDLREYVRREGILIQELERVKSIHNCFEYVLYHALFPLERSVNTEAFNYEVNNFYEKYNEAYDKGELDFYLEYPSQMKEIFDLDEEDRQIIEQLNIATNIKKTNSCFLLMLDFATSVNDRINPFVSQYSRPERQQGTIQIYDMREDVKKCLRQADISMQNIIKILNSLSNYVHNNLKETT